MTDNREADIVISGVPLTGAQSMMVRVAVSNLLMQCSDFLGERESAIFRAYLERGQEVSELIMRTAR